MAAAPNARCDWGRSRLPGNRIASLVVRRCLVPDRGIVLGTFAPIEHAIVPHHSHNAMPSAHTSKQARLEPFGRRPISPRSQERQLPLIVDAGEDIVIDQFLGMATELQTIRQGGS